MEVGHFSEGQLNPTAVLPPSIIVFLLKYQSETINCLSSSFDDQTSSFFFGGGGGRDPQKIEKIKKIQLD